MCLIRHRYPLSILKKCPERNKKGDLSDPFLPTIDTVISVLTGDWFRMTWGVTDPGLLKGGGGTRGLHRNANGRCFKGTKRWYIHAHLYCGGGRGGGGGQRPLFLPKFRKKKLRHVVFAILLFMLYHQLSFNKAPFGKSHSPKYDL